MLMNKGFRYIEAFIISLLVVIAVCFAIQIALAAPPIREVLGGYIPSREIVMNPEMLYIAIGILGATVMPHNLYLHSSIVQTRQFTRDEAGKRHAIRWATTDSTIALMLALFVNSAILIMAASVFHGSGRTGVAEIEEAYALLSPLSGVAIASTLFAIALLASGAEFDRYRDTRRSDRDGRLPEPATAALGAPAGHARHRHRPGRDRNRALRRAGHRAAAGAQPGRPVDAIAVRGDPAGAVRVIAEKMGTFVIPKAVAALAWFVAAVIVALNLKLLFDTFVD